MTNADKTEALNEARKGLHVLKQAVGQAIDQKRNLGQYWVEWDGEKAVKIWPDGRREAAE